jgi:hypothetical protein
MKVVIFLLLFFRGFGIQIHLRRRCTRRAWHDFF